MVTVIGVEETAAVELGDLLDSGDGAVVTLVAGDTRLAAHRAVLAARSPVFAAMFDDVSTEAGSGQVTIPNVEGPVLRRLLAYMYTLQAPKLPSIALQLLAASDTYGLADLREQCEQQVATQLSVETAAATAVLAITNSYASLRRAAIAFIRAHVSQVLGTKGWADAMRSQPEALIEVSRQLSDPPEETSDGAAADTIHTHGASSQPYSDPGQNFAAATATASVSYTVLPDDFDISSMSVPVIAESIPTPGTHSQLQDDHVQLPVAATTTTAARCLPLPDVVAVCRKRARAAEGNRHTDGAPRQFHIDHDRGRDAVTTTALDHRTSSPDEAAVSSKRARIAPDSGPASSTRGQPHSDHGQTPVAGVPSTASCNTASPDGAVPSRKQVPTAAGSTSTPGTCSQPHSDHGQTPIAATRTAAITTTTPSGGALSFYIRKLLSLEKGKRVIEAARKGSVEELRALLAGGADVGERDGYRETALHWAAQEGHLETARCLLEAGAELDARNSAQEMPLHLAALGGHAAVVRLLVASSADPNARDADGRTPLHWAAWYGHAEVATALLEAEGDKGARTNEGKTPLDFARQKNHQHLIHMLR